MPEALPNDDAHHIADGSRVPEYLLERARERREALNNRNHEIKKVSEGIAAAAVSFGNTLLSFGLSEQFNDCSIAAATACQVVQERMTDADEQKELVFLGEDGNYATLLTKAVSSETPMPSGRHISFVLGRDQTTPESPVYLFAVTRNDLALRLASFSRRRSDVVCDYVQLGREMEDENYVVTPSDEKESRLDIIEKVKQLVVCVPVHAEMEKTLELTYQYLLFPNMRPAGYENSSKRLAKYLLTMELERLGIIHDPNLIARWQATNPLSSRMNRRRNDKYREAITKFVHDELRNDKDEPIAQKHGVHMPYSSNDRLHAVIEAYKTLNSDTTIAQELAGSLEIDQTLEQYLGNTNSEYEQLFSADNLPRCAQMGVVRGMRPGVKIGKTTSNSEFELTVETIGKSGYRVVVSGRPAAMSDRSFAHMHTVEFYRDRVPNALSLATSGDILDLLKYVTPESATT